MKLLNSVAPLAERYDGFVIDLWGVVHDGRQALPGAAEALAALRDAGKPVVFLSNVPRRAWVAEAQLARFGIPRELYTAVVTSGEVTWELLRDRDHPFFAGLGRRAWQLGPEGDRSVVEPLDLALVPTPEEAEFILNTGPDPELGPGALLPYEPLLRRCAARALPMVCVNPDREVVVGGQVLLCAGAFADRYRALGGGPVFEVGKPDPTVYGPVLRRLGLPRERVVALGDGPRTDLAGAAAAGLDAVWVLGGLSAGLEVETLDGVAAAEGVSPIAALRALRW